MPPIGDFDGGLFPLGQVGHGVWDVPAQRRPNVILIPFPYSLREPRMLCCGVWVARRTPAHREGESSVPEEVDFPRNLVVH